MLKIFLGFEDLDGFKWYKLDSFERLNIVHKQLLLGDVAIELSSNFTSAHSAHFLARYTLLLGVWY